jgi:hypothetical protein
MKEIDTISIDQKSHSLKITVYPNIVVATVYLTFEESARYMQFGGVQAERDGLQDLMSGIFNEEYPGKKVFFTEEKFSEYMLNKGLRAGGGGGNYSKNTIFELNPNDFEKSLDGVLKYIRAKSEDYERRKSPNKGGIVKNLFNKYFGNKQ